MTEVKQITKLLLLCISFLMQDVHSMSDVAQEINRHKQSKLTCDELATSYTFIKTIEARNCFLGLLRRKTDNRLFLIKQKKRLVRIALSIFESILADLVARTMSELRSQEVFVVQAGCKFPGKQEAQWPASVHTVVPGKSILQWKRSDNQTLRKWFSGFHLRQNFKLSEFEKIITGVTEDIIKSMSFHPDLPHITAFHTILGYYDGHNGNIFYDPDTNHFYIIDMDSICKANLCKITLKNFEKMIHDKSVKFSRLELAALKKYADTLETLMERNPYQRIVDITNEIGVQIGSDFIKKYRVTVILTIEQIRKFIKESYRYGKDLVATTYKLIEAKS
jgi:hypothetical protein